MSLTYSQNNNGPKIDPSGILRSNLAMLEYFFEYLLENVCWKDKIQTNLFESGYDVRVGLASKLFAFQFISICVSTHNCFLICSE